ncbi:hypothetical protein ADINL_0519 [Nitrincola lacisaponensis]|uniref:Uncharacterized protein n=1 Tax=Nitrincola lacisaponensis TaxID=267850 RepID=A0A063Y6V8_9GAMM|nr:hypothetical protein ADINL_0519 [Nitrincola lacisaponensis]
MLTHPEEIVSLNTSMLIKWLAFLASRSTLTDEAPNCQLSNS